MNKLRPKASRRTLLLPHRGFPANEEAALDAKELPVMSLSWREIEALVHPLGAGKTMTLALSKSIPMTI